MTTLQSAVDKFISAIKSALTRENDFSGLHAEIESALTAFETRMTRKQSSKAIKATGLPSTGVIAQNDSKPPRQRSRVLPPDRHIAPKAAKSAAPPAVPPFARPKAEKSRRSPAKVGARAKYTKKG